MEVMDSYYSYGLGLDIMPNDQDWGDQFLAFCSQKGLVGTSEWDNPNVYKTADGQGLVCKTGTGMWEGRPGATPKMVTPQTATPQKPLTMLTGAQQALIRQQVQRGYTSSRAAFDQPLDLRHVAPPPGSTPLVTGGAAAGGLGKLLPIAAMAMVALAVLK